MMMLVFTPSSSSSSSSFKIHIFAHSVFGKGCRRQKDDSKKIYTTYYSVIADVVTSNSINNTMAFVILTPSGHHDLIYDKLMTIILDKVTNPDI